MFNVHALALNVCWLRVCQQHVVAHMLTHLVQPCLMETAQPGQACQVSAFNQGDTCSDNVNAMSRLR
jgi:hypothetical protein